MRASDLVGRRVITTDGATLGRVLGLRCVQDGPVRGANATLRLAWLVVHRRALGAFLGYQLREEQVGPRPVGWLFRLLHRDVRLVAWSDVVDRDGVAIVVRQARDPG